jgi:hypothetical protein
MQKNERRCGEYLHTVWDLENAFDDEPTGVGGQSENVTVTYLYTWLWRNRRILRDSQISLHPRYQTWWW